MFRSFSIVVCFLILSNVITSQEQIFISNGSFEGEPNCCRTPEGWRNCGHVTETPPDIQPALNERNEPFFGITKKAYLGNTYVGMVVRSNETNERIGQKLLSPLIANTCYSFSIYLTKSEVYLSATQNNPQALEQYTTPVVLRVWGGEAYCNQKELLYETEAISNIEWKKYDIEFKPKFTHTYIELEAYYKTPVLFPYNGNVLLDNMSHIKVIPCPNTKEYAAYVKEKKAKDAKELKEKKRDTVAIATKPIQNSVPKSKNESTASNDKILKELEIKKIKVGQTIKIEKLYFKADSTNFNAESLPVLDELFDFLYKNRTVRVEVGGHTNNTPSTAYCDRLSSQRAKSVKDYLIGKGIDSTRITYKGYGKRNPIAGNSTKEGKQLNQRVEIKILSLEG